MAEATLERLEPELRHVRIVFTLGALDERRTNQASEIDCLCHDRYVLVGHTGHRARQRPTPSLTRGRLVRGLGPRPEPEAEPRAASWSSRRADTTTSPSHLNAGVAQRRPRVLHSPK